jgi:ferritin-like protein
VVDERIVQELEKSGFPKSYILNALNNDELNYVTTYYYLLTTVKEY